MGAYFVFKTNKGKIEFDFTDKEEIAEILKDYGDAKILTVEEIEDETLTLWFSPFPDYFEDLTIQEVIKFLNEYYSFDEKLMCGALEYFKEKGEDNDAYILKKIVNFVKNEKIEFVTNTRNKEYEEIINDLINFGYIKPVDKLYLPFIDFQSLYDHLLDEENFVEYEFWLFYVED